MNISIHSASSDRPIHHIQMRTSLVLAALLASGNPDSMLKALETAAK